MPKALKATEETVDYIVNYAKELGFDLSYLPYSIKDAAEYGSDLYVVTDGTSENNNVTFTEFASSTDFFRLWKFTNAETNQFEEIERI